MAGQRSLVALLVAVAVAGCGSGGDVSGDDGLSKDQKSNSSRLSQAFQRSGGDFDKLTPDDKAFVLSTTNGDERLARRMWMIRGSAQIGPGGGGPPTGGPLVGGPGKP